MGYPSYLEDIVARAVEFNDGRSSIQGPAGGKQPAEPGPDAAVRAPASELRKQLQRVFSRKAPTFDDEAAPVAEQRRPVSAAELERSIRRLSRECARMERLFEEGAGKGWDMTVSEAVRILTEWTNRGQSHTATRSASSLPYDFAGAKAAAKARYDAVRGHLRSLENMVLELQEVMGFINTHLKRCMEGIPAGQAMVAELRRAATCQSWFGALLSLWMHLDDLRTDDPAFEEYWMRDFRLHGLTTAMDRSFSALLNDVPCLDIPDVAKALPCYHRQPSGALGPASQDINSASGSG